MGDFWIEFNDLSRSYVSVTPHKGSWDNRSSRVWINGHGIDPPDWKRAGVKGSLEVPLMDEGYAYREPTQIPLKRAGIRY